MRCYHQLPGRKAPHGVCFVAMIVGVVLSGGASTRMGQPKALLQATRPGDRAPGGSFLERICANLARAGISTVIVVTGTHDAVIRAHIVERSLDVTVVTNPDPSRGQLSSLWCALDEIARLAVPVEGIAMTPVDHPWASPTTVRSLVDEFRRTRAPIVRPLATDGTHGHPVIFSAATFDLLRRADPAKGAKAVINALADAIHHVPVDDAGAFADVDTPEDYARGLKASGASLREPITEASKPGGSKPGA